VPVVAAAQPVFGGGQALGVGRRFAQQGSGDGRAGQFAQGGFRGCEDGLRRAAGGDQAPRRVTADAGRLEQPEPGREVRACAQRLRAG